MVNSNSSSCGVDQGWGTSHIYLAYDRVGFLSQKKKKKKNVKGMTKSKPFI